MLMLFTSRMVPNVGCEPLNVTVIKRLEENGLRDYEIASSQTVGNNGRIEVRCPVGVGAIIAISVSGGIQYDNVGVSVFTSNA